MKSKMIFYPAPLPDEHILSTLARWHAMQGVEGLQTSAKKLTKCIHNLNPSAIWRPAYQDIFNAYGGALPIEKFMKHTLYNYYETFEPHEAYINEVKINNRWITPKNQFQLKFVKIWRWCQFCAREDYNRYGTTFWHLSHQIPSTICCPKHHTKLTHTCNKCDFITTNLGELPLPPENNKCPNCNAEYIVENTITPTQKWINDISIKIHLGITKSTLPKIKEKMIAVSGYALIDAKKTLKQKCRMGEIQRDFNEFICQSGIKEFFSNPSILENSSSRNIVLISKILHSTLFFPPLYYFALASFIKTEKEILDNFFIGEEDYA